MKKKLASLSALAFLLSQAASAQLMVNELNGFNAGGEVPVTVVFQECRTSTVNQTTYNFTNVNIGTAAADRVVVVGVSSEDSATVFNTSGVAVGGNAATERHDTAAATTTYSASLYTIAVTSGTTATVAATLTEAVESANICVWATYGMKSQTPLDSGTISGTGSDTLSPTGDGGAIFCSGSHSGTAGNSIAFDSQLTVDADANNTEASYGAARMATTGAGVTLSGSAGSNAGLWSCAAFR